MIEYSEDWLFSLLFRHKGSVAFRACRFALPSALAALVLVLSDDPASSLHGWRGQIGAMSFTASPLWTASTAVLAVLLSFRANRAMARFWEGTGLLHQMRGEWFDSVSCCVTFSRAAVKDKPDEVREFRHTIVRLMSLCHGSALEEISGFPSDKDRMVMINAVGLDNQTLRHLADCKMKHDFNRVEVLLHLIQSLITKNLDDGILKIAPPILSRVYQTLSRGFVNLLNAKKIADTRFPFPFAQTIAILLFFHLIMTPLVMACLVNHVIWSPVFTFIPMFGMFSLNFIGVELENPFGDDDNDLPLSHFQHEMNKCLLMLLQENADLIPGMSQDRGLWDFKTLVESMHEGGDKDDIRHSGSGGANARVSDFERFPQMVDDEEAPRPTAGLLSEKEHSGAPAPSGATLAPAPSITVDPGASLEIDDAAIDTALAVAAIATENFALHLDARGGQWVCLPEAAQGRSGTASEALGPASAQPKGALPETGEFSGSTPASKSPDSYVEVAADEAPANLESRMPPPVGFEERREPEVVRKPSQVAAASPSAGGSAEGTPRRTPLAQSTAASSPHSSPHPLLCSRQALPERPHPHPG